MRKYDSYISVTVTKGIVIAHLNIQSILPKIEELRFHVDQSNIKILSINETFLDHSINDCEIGITKKWRKLRCKPYLRKKKSITYNILLNNIHIQQSTEK